MPAWGARALRRFLLTMVMVAGIGQLFVYRTLHARPELPPGNADRLVAAGAGGVTREIRDPRRVKRIVSFVRSRGESYRFDGNSDHIRGMPTMCFFRGAEEHGCIRWSLETILVYARYEVVVFRLSPDEGAELQRLLGVPAPPPEPGRG